MPYTRLFLLVEGDDDARFVEHVVTPRLVPRYTHVQTYKYAQKNAERVEALLRSIKSMGADYFLLADLDAYPCFPKKREALVGRFKNLDRRQAVIVIRKVESWYLAGLRANNPLAVREPAYTEHFEQTMPNRFDSRIDYMIEVLKHFDIATASSKNLSFRYFARRCGLLQS